MWDVIDDILGNRTIGWGWGRGGGWVGEGGVPKNGCKPNSKHLCIKGLRKYKSDLASFIIADHLQKVITWQ